VRNIQKPLVKEKERERERERERETKKKTKREREREREPPVHYFESKNVFGKFITN
jgi:hypothetical protein